MTNVRKRERERDDKAEQMEMQRRVVGITREYVVKENKPETKLINQNNHKIIGTYNN